MMYCCQLFFHAFRTATGPVPMRARPWKWMPRESAPPTGVLAASWKEIIPNTPQWLLIDHFLLAILTA